MHGRAPSSTRGALLALALLAGCSSGGGGGGGDPTPASTYQISGTITGASSVAVSLTGTATASTTTDAGGTYAFAGLANGTYTVTPSKGGFVFDPISAQTSVNGADVDLDFTATAAANTYTISGTVSGATGVTMTLSGGATGTFTANGAFTTPALADGGTYTLTPTKTGYDFDPVSITTALSGANEAAANFTASLKKYTIAGTLGGVTGGTTGVTMTVTKSGAAHSTFDASGTYTSGPLDHGGSYTITPTKVGFTYDPPSATFNPLTGNQTGVNFAAAVATYTIAGTVTGATGVTMTITKDGVAHGTPFSATGAYTSAALEHGGNYVITPTKAGYTFDPPSATFNPLTGNVTQDFTATLDTYTISGTVSGATGVTMTITGQTAFTANGAYTSGPLNHGGSYTITPTKVGYDFDPPSATFNPLTGNVTQDFTATVKTYTISGTIGGAAGGTTGVTFTISGSADASFTGGAAYTSGPLAHGGDYTITPTKVGFTYTPPSARFNPLTGNVTQNFTAVVAPVPTFTLSGTITGPYVEDITVELLRNGSTIDTTTTLVNGTYSFTGVTAGTYVVSPSLPGYTFTPTTPGDVTITTASAAKSFTQASTVPSYSISGAIGYAGERQGRIYVRASPMSGPGIGNVGTSVLRTGNSTSYTLRGLVPGTTYTVTAWLDSLGYAMENVTNPSGQLSMPVTVYSNLTGQDFALTDPTLGVAQPPTDVTVFPAVFPAGGGGAFVIWEPPQDTNWVEAATSYRVSWGTDANASIGGGSAIVDARDDTWRIVTGLTVGQTYYFKVSAFLDADESDPVVSGAVTIAAPSTGRSVSGTITVPAAGVGKPLYVAVTDDAGVFEWTRRTATASTSYAVSGLAAGTYGVYVVVDVNDNGYMDIGDLGTETTVTVASTNVTGVNGTVTADAYDASVRTQHGKGYSGTGEWYNVAFEVRQGAKLPVEVTILSGANIRVPMDVSKDWDFQSWQNTGSARPTVGDEYRVRVTYWDGTSYTTETKTLLVTGVVDHFPRNLGTVTTTPYSPTVPLLTWAAPSPAPGYVYTYRLGFWGNANWWYPEGLQGLPSSTTSMVYNADDDAWPPTLVPGQTYVWYVEIEDANGNRGQQQAQYTVPF